MVADIMTNLSESPYIIAFEVSITWFLLYAFYSYFCLSHIPGPFLASISNIPRLYWVLTGRAHDIHIALHDQYGPLMRMGSNMVSVSDPQEIGKIYGITGK